jgi:hypothetical protein
LLIRNALADALVPIENFLALHSPYITVRKLWPKEKRISAVDCSVLFLSELKLQEY